MTNILHCGTCGSKTYTTTAILNDQKEYAMNERRFEETGNIYKIISIMRDEIVQININIGTLNDRLASVLCPLNPEDSKEHSSVPSTESPMGETLSSMACSMIQINKALKSLISQIDL